MIDWIGLEHTAPIAKCSACGSTLTEHVMHGFGANAVKFRRCLSCRHESARSPVYPPPTTGSLGWKNQPAETELF